MTDFIEQFNVMCEMQDGFNSVLFPNWREKKLPWYRAIWLESAEMLEHYGYKWWKSNSTDIDQVKMEMIDIIHFGISDMLQTMTFDEVAYKLNVAMLNHPPRENSTKEEVRCNIEVFAEETLKNKSFCVEEFAVLASGIQLTTSEIYQLYIIKNTLNKFRQDNGYKDPNITYHKVFNGKEDNEHMVHLAKEMDQGKDFKDELYLKMQELYDTINDK